MGGITDALKIRSERNANKGLERTSSKIGPVLKNNGNGKQETKRLRLYKNVYVTVLLNVKSLSSVYHDILSLL